MADDSLSNQHKRCKACEVVKPLSEFYVDKRDGRSASRCKTCRYVQTRIYVKANPEQQKLWHKKSRIKNASKLSERGKSWRRRNPDKVLAYSKRNNRKRMLRSLGITAADLEAAFENQMRCCAICEVGIVLTGSRRVHIDHCHKTNKFRGLLCSTCNTGLGKFRDDTAMLLRAVSYLGREGCADEAEGRKKAKARS